MESQIAKLNMIHGSLEAEVAGRAEQAREPLNLVLAQIALILMAEW